MPFQPPPPEVVRLLRPQLSAIVGALLRARFRPEPGLQLSSWWRDADHNRGVGGSPESQHLGGLGIDVHVIADQRSFAAAFVREGLVAIPFGQGAVHIQSAPAGELARLGVLRLLG